MRCYYNTSRWGYNIANYLNMESPIRIVVRVCVEKLQTIIYMKYMGRTCIFHTKYRERNLNWLRNMKNSRLFYMKGNIWNKNKGEKWKKK